MEIILFFAGLRFLVRSERNLNVNPVLQGFIDSIGADAEISVRITWNWDRLSLDNLSFLGEDLLCRYYRQKEKLLCLSKGNTIGPLGCALYGPDCSDIDCYINERPFLFPPDDLGSILRILPMRAIFQRFGVLFLHASQISYRGRGIIFTAPSGTGKTTQARLWQKARGAEIICNDRTLLRKMEDRWLTFGYPIDGSEPVRSNQVNELGAVVLLAQGPENQIRRLHPGKAAGLLMGQVVMDSWNVDARTAAIDRLLSLLADIPVYLQTCTPDEYAVDTLETTLIKDEVISFGPDCKTPLA